MAGLLFIGATYVLTILCFVAFRPSVPSEGLDASWVYGLASASQHRLAFGRDMIFTFGPFACLYTDFRLPGQNALYLMGASLIAAALVTGLALSAARGRQVLLLLLPFIVANTPLKDALLLAIPLMLVFASCAPRGQFWGPSAMLLAAANGLLPLIKGTMLVPVAGCLGLACVALLRDRSLWALILPAVASAAMAAAWLAVGQAPFGVVGYVLNLSQVAAGYTDAMSLFGPKPELYAFAGAVTVLAGAAAWRVPRHGPIKALALVLVGFVAFKAGFVRHDGHAVIAGFFLAIAALLVAVEGRRGPAIVGFAAGMAAFAFVVSSYLAIDPFTLWSRFDDRVKNATASVIALTTHPDETYRAFDEAKATVRRQAAVPALDGTVDVYPVDIADVLASNLQWAPRPILQSYSAYTPELAALNAHHLAGGSAPDHILFDIAPIDGRYPNLEDGASWPALLRHYDFRTFAGRFALLDRSTEEHQAIAGEALLSGRFGFGQEIALPDRAGPIWAQLRFTPTLMGRLSTLLFKRPLLSIDVTYVSGRHAHYRFIAGMAQEFLLSPTISSARDFIALMGGKADLLEPDQVISFHINQDSRFTPWGRAFNLVLSHFNVARHASADDAFPTPPMQPPSSAK